MAFSMMSSTNHKRKLDELLLLPNNNNNTTTTDDEDDWMSLDLDFLAEADYNDNDNNDENQNISSSSFDDQTSSDYSVDDAVHGNDNNNKKKKKRKTLLETFVDHDLEDTASSSPPHTPNKGNTTFNPFYMKSKEMQSRDLCQENGNTLQQEGDTTKMSLLESELRKKGLCLIPTSMLLNYLTANA